jgi:hypothetical protein
MPKMIARGYDEDKTLSFIVAMFEGPVTAANVQQLADLRAAMEYDLGQAVKIGDSRKISALRDALADMSQ